LFYYFQEPRFLKSPTFNIEESFLQSIQSRVTFLENLVCSKMTNLNLSNQDKGLKGNTDVKKAEDPILGEKVIFNSNCVILRYFFTF